MYRGFNLKIDNYTRQSNSVHEEYYQLGHDLLSQDKRAVRSTLEALVLRDGSLDGAQLQKQWFPVIEADVFLSHSHQNEEATLILAGYLRKAFGITSFIDSTVWGYSNDLLQDLDDKYCRNVGASTYDYRKRNFSTSHVYLMLAGALAKMIDNTECVFFLNTPQAIQPNKVIDSTLSPWLYSEILTTQYVRKRPPHEHSARQQLTKSFSEGGQLGSLNESRLAVTYEVDMSHLTSISAGIFNSWLKRSEKERFKLDALYKMYPLDKRLLNS